ncbi:unnamed protein product [Arctia plantaginis]|uniref:Ig-like domain-containing protein n=1 Tax=Arctia plantaginis TaxID=874455 RepID=A0A8S1A7C3_ARCPL|nr:unnamed protein product [Arctia plantaginis]CAB3251260.1 unnamed protein product [Arctia plantaginis]
MRRQFALPLALLFIALGVSSNAQTEGPTPVAAPTSAIPAAPEAVHPVVMYDVGRTFTLNCSVASTPGVAIVWKKNDTAVESLWDLRGRYTLDREGTVFKLSSRTTEDDFGNYTCSLGDNSETWEVRGRPHAKLQHNTNVVEKQNLKLTCKLTGKPYPAVTWLFNNGTENGTDVAVALGSRVTLQTSAQGVAGAELVLKDAERTDAGEYTCVPEAGLSAATTLRVKDQYAALWPFLGICAEVFVLCAIILVYEKRRTKPELDDSDTDNHDQKKS